MILDFDDMENVLFSLNQLAKVPVYLDDNSEMQVGVMLINPQYVEDFDACPPMRTHKKQCAKHGQHVDHYSLPGKPRKSAKIEIKVTPI